jgi:hypothetical protein
MSHAPTASALISTFVRDNLNSLLILPHDFIGQRWPSSVITGCRTAPGRPRPLRQLPQAFGRKSAMAADDVRAVTEAELSGHDGEDSLAAAAGTTRLCQKMRNGTSVTLM